MRGRTARPRATTVKLLSAMLSPDRGTVRVLGMDPVRDRVRYVNHIGRRVRPAHRALERPPGGRSFEWNA